MSMPTTPAARPSLALAFAELFRATAELSTLPFAAPILSWAPRGDGHPVLVLPGFGAGDSTTLVLRQYLTNLGYDVHRWELGPNLDERSTGAEGAKLAARIADICAEAGRKVSLVGWSLGGMLAREAARRDPDSVRQVISLGSPFAGDPHATNAWRAFEWLTGQRIDSPEYVRRSAEAALPPPVPSVAIFSKSDGIVAWRNCLEPEGTYTDNIEVCSSHCGLVVHPAVLYAVADRLALPENEWHPFDRSGWRAAFYPSSGHIH